MKACHRFRLNGTDPETGCTKGDSCEWAHMLDEEYQKLMEEQRKQIKDRKAVAAAAKATGQ